MKLSHRRSTAKYMIFPSPGLLTKRQFRRLRGRTSYDGYYWVTLARRLLPMEAIYDRRADEARYRREDRLLDEAEASIKAGTFKSHHFYALDKALGLR